MKNKNELERVLQESSRLAFRSGYLTGVMEKGGGLHKIGYKELMDAADDAAEAYVDQFRSKG